MMKVLSLLGLSLFRVAPSISRIVVSFFLPEETLKEFITGNETHIFLTPTIGVVRTWGEQM